MASTDRQLQFATAVVAWGVDSLARSQIRIDASLMNARKLAASLSYRVATRRHCLIEENRTQPIVMRFTRRKSEMDRQIIGVHHRVNLARQAPSRATHILVIVVRDRGSVLVHAHDGGIDHLHRRITTGSQRFHDLAPDDTAWKLPRSSRCLSRL
jgi:hypothetical protein